MSKETESNQQPKREPSESISFASSPCYDLISDKDRLDWLENPEKCYHVCIDRQPDGYSIVNTHPDMGIGYIRRAIDAEIIKHNRQI